MGGPRRRTAERSPSNRAGWGKEIPAVDSRRGSTGLIPVCGSPGSGLIESPPPPPPPRQPVLVRLHSFAPVKTMSGSRSVPRLRCSRSSPSSRPTNSSPWEHPLGHILQPPDHLAAVALIVGLAWPVLVEHLPVERRTRMVQGTEVAGGFKERKPPSRQFRLHGLLGRIAAIDSLHLLFEGALARLVGTESVPDRRQIAEVGPPR